MANPYRTARRFERFLPNAFSRDISLREDYTEGEPGENIATIIYLPCKKEIAVKRER